MEKKYIAMGSLLIMIILTATYISFQGKVRLRIDDDKAVFYVNDSRWRISAIQNDRLFSGSSIIDRVRNTIERNNYTSDGMRVEYRSTGYENGETVLHRWTFNPGAKDVEEFPIKEEICVSNAKGKYYRYSLDRLKDTGEKRKLTGETSASFGYNMKVNFESDYSWAWIGWPYGSDSFAVQYKIKSNEECFNIRLFDPPGFAGINITITFPVNNTNYLANVLDLNWSVNITANTSVYSLDGGANNTAIFFGNVPTNVSLGGLEEGKHNITIYVNDSSGNWGLSDLLVFNITHPLSVVLNPGLTQLSYNVNWSKVTEQINFSEGNTSIGNYSWNFTDLNLVTYPLVNWTYNITNNRTVNITVSLRISRITDYFNWTWTETNLTINQSFQNLFNLTPNSSKLMNFTLNLINTSQVYVNWSVTNNRANWTFIPIFNQTVRI